MKTKSNQPAISRTSFFYHAFRNIFLVSLPALVISTLILSLPYSSAYSSSTDSVSLTLPSACTISANVISEHNATLVNGQVEENIGNTKINAYCNDNNGYFIYAIGSSNNIDGNTDLISNINNDYNIHTGIYSLGNTNSSWAMKLSSNNGTYTPAIMNGYENYSEIPNTDTIVAFRTSGTSMDLNTDLTGSYFNTTYQIYANSIQPAGTYLGKVKYTMTHPYDSSQLTTIEEAFDTVGIDKVTVPGVGSYYAMQDMSPRICNLANAYNAEEQLIDIRDNKVYYVSKLLDGHCWMTQNLDTDINSSISFDSNNTDLNVIHNDDRYTEYNEGYTINGSVIYWEPVNTIIDFTGTAVTGWQNSTTTPYSANKTDSTEAGHASLGNYYNWTAAIASNNSDTLTSVTVDNVSQNPQNSICPKGWRLPTISNESETLAGSTNEFARLNYLYNANNINSKSGLITTPLFFIQPGYIYENFAGQGVNGPYWSSTYYNNFAYYLDIVDEGVNVNNNGIRSLAFSVRCVAR